MERIYFDRLIIDFLENGAVTVKDGFIELYEDTGDPRGYSIRIVVDTDSNKYYVSSL